MHIKTDVTNQKKIQNMKLVFEGEKGKSREWLEKSLENTSHFRISPANTYKYLLI
jgi:hypothetical protein